MVELLQCEKCHLKCVPEYVREHINDPVLCIACRMSRYFKERVELSERGIYKRVTMHEITPDMEGELIQFNCLINGLDEKKTYYTKAIFTCPKCNLPLEIFPDDIYETETPKCPEHRIEMKLEKKMSVTDSIRYVSLEEPQEESIDSNAQRFDGLCRGILANGSINWGKRMVITAIYKSIPSGKKRGYNDIILDIQTAKDMDSDKDELPTVPELEWLKEESKKEGFIDKVRASITPAVNLSDIQLSALVSMAHGCTNEMVKRDDIHLAIFGDPSTFKSELLEFIHKIVPNSKMVDGGNTGKVGLRGGIESVNGRRPYFVPGAMTMANGSILCYDELDKTPKEDYPALYKGMEQQYIEYDKLMHVRSPTDCTVIATANPKTGYYDKDQTLQQNFNIPFALQTRFDLIWFIPSVQSEEASRKIAQLTAPDYIWEPYLSEHMLRKYINYVKKLTPTLTVPAHKMIEDFWVKAKVVSSKQTDGIKIEPRHLHGLIRIAFAFAKLQFHETVTIEDAESAIGLFKRSLKTLGQDVETGELVQEILHGKKQGKMKVFMDCVNSLGGRSPEGIIDHNEAVEWLVKSGSFDIWEAPKELESQARRGDFIINTERPSKYRLAK